MYPQVILPRQVFNLYTFCLVQEPAPTTGAPGQYPKDTNATGAPGQYPKDTNATGAPGQYPKDTNATGAPGQYPRGTAQKEEKPKKKKFKVKLAANFGAFAPQQMQPYFYKNYSKYNTLYKRLWWLNTFCWKVTVLYRYGTYMVWYCFVLCRHGRLYLQ